MGDIISVTCRNKACRYHFEVREGESCAGFARVRKLEMQLKENRDAPDSILELLDKGEHIYAHASYLCPTCREWVNDTVLYILEKISVSPYGTVRDYKVHYLDTPPKCKKCKAELIFLLNPRSGKNKCPKCGMDNMRAKLIGSFD